eukprot:COSAG06_NODE_102_length_23983_cov_152.911363_15_plen_102_part_00
MHPLGWSPRSSSATPGAPRAPSSSGAAGRHGHRGRRCCAPRLVEDFPRGTRFRGERGKAARCAPAQNTHKGGTNAETYISLLSCSASCASYQQLCAIDMER